MKILHLVTGLEVGDGIVEVVYAMNSRLDRRQLSPMICALRGTGSYHAWFEKLGIPVFVCDAGAPSGWGQYLRTLRIVGQVRRFIKTNQVDVLHAHNFFAGMVGVLASLGLPGLRRVLTMHGDYFLESWTQGSAPAFLRRNLFRIFFRRWETVIGVSHAVCRWVESFGKPPSPVRCIHNGIRPERFSEPVDGADMKQQWEIPMSAKVVGTLGILEKIKGGENFLKAAAQVLVRNPDTYFVFIGARAAHEPETLLELRQLADRLGLSERVRFTDPLPDVARALAALDLFIFTPMRAAFGLALAEAMYMGKPVVAARVGGIPEIVEDGISGLLVPPQDREALSQAILRVLSNDPLADRLGQAGRQRIERFFLADRMAMNYQNLYRPLKSVTQNGERETRTLEPIGAK